MSYDPTIGRWLQQDPEGYVDGQNAYQMERSNPVAFVDPFGLFGSLGAGNGHEVVTQRGLAESGLPHEIIDIILRANTGQDIGYQNNSYPFNDPSNHGDNSLFGDTFEFMNWRWNSIRNTAGKGTCVTCEELYEALKDFGKILHAIQDIYAHSNYIEMMNEKMGGGADVGAENPIPLWPMGPGASYIPEGVFSGNYIFHAPLPWLRDPSPFPTHDLTSKDSPDSPAGRVTNRNGVSMYDLAVDAAARSTSEAWDQFAEMFPNILSQIERCDLSWPK